MLCEPDAEPGTDCYQHFDVLQQCMVANPAEFAELQKGSAGLLEQQQQQQQQSSGSSDAALQGAVKR